MNWQKMSAPEFLHWLSLEGLDGLALVEKEYAELPWSLRAILYIRREEMNQHIEQPSEWSYDRSENFRGALTQDEPRKELGNPYTLRGLAEIWLDHEFLGSETNLANGGQSKTSQELVRLLAGELIISMEVEAQFQKWLIERPVKPEIEVIKGHEGGINWDEMWEYRSNEALLWAPVSYLDKWRNVSDDQRHYVMSRVLTLPARPVPEHWVNEIITQTVQVVYPASLLALYLKRPEVSLEIRRQYRQDSVPRLKQAAWALGECSEEELANLTPWDWQFLAEREDISVLIAKGLLKNIPQMSNVWCTNPKHSKEVRLLAVKAGQSINWGQETDREVLEAGLKYGNLEIWQDMASQARRAWEVKILVQLIECLANIPYISDWPIKRALHLGGINPTRDLLKILLNASSQQVRLLGATLIGSAPREAKALGPSRGL